MEIKKSQVNLINSMFYKRKQAEKYELIFLQMKKTFVKAAQTTHLQGENLQKHEYNIFQGRNTQKRQIYIF